MKKPIYKKWWFWAIVVWLLLGFATLIAACSFLGKAIGDIDPENIPTIPHISATEQTEESTALPETEAPTTPTTEQTTEPTAVPTTVPYEETTEAVISHLDVFIRKPLTDFMVKANELGYTATYLADGVDFTEFIDFMKEDYLVGGIKEDPTAKTVVVDLLLASNAEHENTETALREKLESGAAWVAVEKFGKDFYGDFEVHYLLGKITEYAEDTDTWFLKAECTLYGDKCVCEALVTGTTDAPEVLSLDIY